MRNFEELDTGSFRAFWAACETLNFTEAARRAGMTQSGISQHVSRLEKQLGAPLFDRVNKRVFLTEAGEILRAYVETFCDGIEQLKEQITEQDRAIAGGISYAMPASCLMTPHLSMMLARRKKDFPGITFDIHLQTNDRILDMVLNNEIHFGFVTKPVQIAGLKSTPYCRESYILVGAENGPLKELTLKSLRELPFVDYPGAEVLFDHWRRFHFSNSGNLSWQGLKLEHRTNSIAAAVTMVEGGLGYTIFPEHCVQSQIKSGRLARHRRPDGHQVENTIYFVTAEGVQLPRRVQRMTEVFFEIVRK